MTQAALPGAPLSSRDPWKKTMKNIAFVAGIWFQARDKIVHGSFPLTPWFLSHH
jgi:hypothetical protein